MDQRIIQLYDSFTHGGLNRRDFLDRLTKLAGSTAAATALLPLLTNNYAHAAIVPENDPRLVAERVAYESPKGKITGYLVRPVSKGKRPAVVVIHENRGLNPHIEDVARRLAIEGFLAFAPDLLSVSGGTPPDEGQARQLHSKTDPKDLTAAAVAAVPFLLTHAESNGNVAAIGFCFGGSVVNQMAAASPDLKAVVSYYGGAVSADQVPAIRAPLLLHYAGLDERVNASIAGYEAALKANDKRYTIYMYPGVNHAFNNEAGDTRYNKAAAELSWARTLAFLREQLGTPASAT